MDGCNHVCITKSQLYYAFVQQTLDFIATTKIFHHLFKKSAKPAIFIYKSSNDKSALFYGVKLISI